MEPKGLVASSTTLKFEFNAPSPRRLLSESDTLASIAGFRAVSSVVDNLIQLGSQFGDDFRMLRIQVDRFTGIVGKIVKLALRTAGSGLNAGRL